DFHVTGVQTCALPIYRFDEPGARRGGASWRRARFSLALAVLGTCFAAACGSDDQGDGAAGSEDGTGGVGSSGNLDISSGDEVRRSEERRVGKGGGSRW